ncbi:MAG: UDP-N-acetylmuramoyl-L-alanine--D-glutamate ligase [Pseudomonadota bacterium]
MSPFDATLRYTVVGLGASGRSVVRFLRDRGAPVFAVDHVDSDARSTALQDEFPGLRFSLGDIDTACLDHTDVLVPSPGVPRDSALMAAARARGLEIIGDIELFARCVEQPVVAVTGTNGKSTVVSMLAACAAHSGLRVGVGGNLGTPALDLLAQPADLYVLELSSYQLETTYSLAPRAAALLNVTPDHLDRYPGGFDDYRAAKLRVFRNATVCVVPVGDAHAQPLSRSETQRTVSVAARPAEVGDVGVVLHHGALWLAEGATPRLPVDDLGASGDHNVANAAFAMALAREAGFSAAAVDAGLRDFRGLRHRTELVRDLSGVRFINDSKGTNVGATCTALESMGCPTVLIAGGVGKAQDFSPLHGALARFGKAAVVFGRDADDIADAIADAVPVQRAGDLGDAVRAARALASVGDAVLFSPACSSFDMFRNFEDRGDAFARTVEALTA